MTFEPLIKIFLLTSLGFILALGLTPILANFLCQNKLGKQIRNDGSTPLFSKLHSSKAGTPTLGGILVWATLTFLIGLFWLLDRVFHIQAVSEFNFLSGGEPLVPLGVFFGASLVGLFDDWLDKKKWAIRGGGF